MAVIDQLKQFGETRRGWLGVKIQEVTDEIAESLGIKPPRGALIAGVDDKGPAKPAGIEPGDVLVTFDGRDIASMRDLPRIVADTRGRQGSRRRRHPQGQGGDQEGDARPPRGWREPQPASATKPDPADDKSVVKKALGLNLANITDDLRRQHKIKDSVKGVVVTAVEPGSAAAEKQLAVGNVIVEVAQEPVATADDVTKRIEKLKGEGRRSALLLVANAEGELRFVALSLQ